MFDDEEEDQGYFLLVLGVLAAVLVIVTIVARSGGDLPAPTVTGPPEEEAAAEVEESTTTTEAPETTTTTEAETTTTTAAPEAEPVTMWDALNDSGQAEQFAAIGEALGLRGVLESFEDDEGNATQLTLFAPNDDAIAAVADQLPALTADPAAAEALVGYHLLKGNFSAEQLLELDGEELETRTGLPMRISVVDGEVVLDDTIRVVGTDFDADNGVVHIVEQVLTPPTINEVIGLNNIEFDVNSANITAAGEEELLKAAAFFTENPDVNAAIEGHTDTDGDAERNLGLSQDRADAVLVFLLDQGLDEGRFTATGFGETRPIEDADGVEDKVASRRIEFNLR